MIIRATLKFKDTLDGLAFVSGVMPYRPRDLWEPEAPFPPMTLVEITTDCEAVVYLCSPWLISLRAA